MDILGMHLLCVLECSRPENRQEKESYQVAVTSKEIIEKDYQRHNRDIQTMPSRNNRKTIQGIVHVIWK